MTAEEWIEKFNAVLLAELNCKASTKYPNRYDVNGYVNLRNKNLIEISVPFGIVTAHFSCSNNQLTSLYNAPIKVLDDFWCADNQLTTLEHLPMYIGGDLFCQSNPFQNLNGLKDIRIKGNIWFSHDRENELDYWIKALYNTNLDALEWHYDYHRYEFGQNHELENYIINELEEIIKVKRLKRDLNV